MDRIESQIMPVPPNLLVSLKAGFDAVANQILIIIIPIAIDIILWLGPHLQVKTLILNFIENIVSSSGITSIHPGDIITTNMDFIRQSATQYNLLSLIRTIPVGIPSLMSGRSPVEIPHGFPLFIDITNPIVAGAIVMSLVLTGIMVGCLFYSIVVQVALQGKIDLKAIMKNWPRASLQVISLSLALLLLFIVISIPSSCVITVIALFGLPLGQFAIFLFLGVLLWLAFPLLFSAHGIFVNHNNALAAVQRSMLLTRMTLPSTSMFVFLILAISEGFDFLWRVPPETSWLTLIGVGGHAFITSALLAASFIYYRDADRWTQQTLKLVNSQKEMVSSGR